MNEQKAIELLEKGERLLIGMGAETAKNDMFFVLKRTQEALAALKPATKQDKGNALKEFRLNVLQLGLRRFAEWIGVRPSCVANIEQGRAYWQTPKIDGKGKMTIPDCKPPTGEDAGEFDTEELRKICTEESKEKHPFIAIEVVIEALDHIDRLEAEKEEFQRKYDDVVEAWRKLEAHNCLLVTENERLKKQIGSWAKSIDESLGCIDAANTAQLIIVLSQMQALGGQKGE